MESFEAAFSRTGGVVSIAQLHESGVSTARRRRAVDRGELRVIRRGWYAMPSADQDVVAAVRAGGALSGISALRHRGIWIPDDARRHVRVPRRLRRATGPVDRSLVIATTPARLVEPPLGSAVDSLEGAIGHVLAVQPGEIAAAIVDSMWHRRLVSGDDVAGWCASLPERMALPLSRIQGRCESGTESLFFLRMQAKRIAIRPQVWIGPYRVDFLIGDRLVVEIDSAAHHGAREQRIRDARRASELVAMGYLVLRFDYREVMHGWSAVEAEVLAFVSRDAHRRRGPDRRGRHN